MICIRFIIIKMPISLSPVIFTALFSLILFSSIQELSAQEKWVDSDNSNESSETIKTLTIEGILALDKQELQSFVEKQSGSHIESYVNIISWMIEKKEYSWVRDLIKLKKTLVKLNSKLKDKISEQKIKEIADKKKKWNDDLKDLDKTIKQLKDIKKEISKQKGDVAMK